MNLKEKLLPYENALKICSLLISNGGEARFIGGCVRDLLIGKEFTDIDIATTLLPDKVENILKLAKLDFFSIGKNFGTITAIINNEHFEITTLRIDTACDGRRAEVIYTSDWQEDAARRDFTINAISCDIDGNIYDYFGGIDDLKNGIVRFIGNPENRIKEDYLRILRYFRFSAIFSPTIDQTTLSIIKENISSIKTVSGTRIRAELKKIFPAQYAVNILEEMLKIKLFDHIFSCSNFPFLVINNLYSLQQEYNFTVNDILAYGLFLKYSCEADSILYNSSFSRSEISRIHNIINSNIDDWSESSLKHYWKIYKENFKEVILVNLAIANKDTICKNLLQRLFNTTILNCPIKASDLARFGIKPGIDMGKLLDIAEKVWFDHEFKISKDNLLRDLKKHVDEL